MGTVRGARQRSVTRNGDTHDSHAFVMRDRVHHVYCPPMASLQGFQSLRQLIDDFVSELTGAIESQATARARDVVEAALATGRIETRRGPGRPSAATLLLAAENGAQSITARRPRKNPPIQLCPVPGCQGRAAPIFGMVCSAHRDLPKAKIKQYREARRAAKQGGAATAKARPGRRPRATATASASPRKVGRSAVRKPKAIAKPAQRAASRRAQAKPPSPARGNVRGKVRGKPQRKTSARAKGASTKAAPARAAKPSAAAAAPKRHPPVLPAPPAAGSPAPPAAETASA
jgi:hypothetical protein